ncbi:MAG: hypothetical protein JF588_15600 [Caulobacterales bacterium]|nr:hypothetical protein [Caulobacterales bacterium]
MRHPLAAASLIAISLIAASVLLAATAARAQTIPPAAALWRELATTDVEAARGILLANHPAALSEARDPAFAGTLALAYGAALAHARQVTSFGGYAATLSAFAVAMGDHHISSGMLLAPLRSQWPGFIVGKRGSAWMVVDEDPGPDGPLHGARLISCDGRAPDDLARESLGVFRADWRVEAQQVQAAPWLLVDEGNPFVTRPKACVLEVGGQRRDVALAWRTVPRARLQPRLVKAMGSGEAGFGVRRAGGGYWISLQSLSASAAPVVEAVRAQQAALRAAPFVVLDVRGNGGGASAYGRQIAEALMGEAHVRGLLGVETADCGEAWRVSPAALASLRADQETIGRSAGAEEKALIDAMYARTLAAQAAGRPFSSDLTCAAPHRLPPAPSLMKGRLVLLTDTACFSSCLSLADDFRRLGALHLGAPTDAATRYTEVVAMPLPSGLALFSTLQALDISSPPRLGPFEPSKRFDGDMADTPAVEAWVLATIPATPAAAGAR